MLVVKAFLRGKVEVQGLNVQRLTVRVSTCHLTFRRLIDVLRLCCGAELLNAVSLSLFLLVSPENDTLGHQCV